MNPEDDCLHVEVARLDAIGVPPDAGDWLHASERDRLADLRAPLRRQQYLAGHWLARDLLARVHGGIAMDWSLLERRDRAPEVKPPASLAAGEQDPIQLGLAHSGDWIAAAVGRHAFGIDIEQRGRRLARAALAPLLLHPDELADGVDDDTLLARWVAKEAWIKRGQGSALPEQLRVLRLHPDPGGALRLYRAPAFHLAAATPAPVRYVGTAVLDDAGAWRADGAGASGPAA